MKKKLTPLTPEDITRRVEVQIDKYEHYLATSAKPDNQAVFAYLNLIKLLLDMRHHGHGAPQKRSDVDLKKAAAEILRDEYGIGFSEN